MTSKDTLARLLEFLEEDVGRGDITTSSVLKGDEVAAAEVIAKGDGVLSGLEEAVILLEHRGIEHSSSLRDGDEIKTREVILQLKGNASEILVVERLLLNLLTRMSGIATATRKLVDICNPYNVKVAGTRKTTPGFRFFEKKAIAHGGGEPHRMGLDDAILIKDNHIAIVGLEESIKRAKLTDPDSKIEVEVSSGDDAQLACKSGADTIMLDNLSADEVAKVISELDKAGLRDNVVIEISGGVTPENIGAYAKSKPNVISTGYMTTKANWLDMSLRVKP